MGVITEVHGRNNRLLMIPPFSADSVIKVKGDNNLVVLEKGFASESKIEIIGDDAIVVFSKKFRVKKVKVRLVADGCILYVGNDVSGKILSVNFVPGGLGAASDGSTCTISSGTTFNGLTTIALGEKATNVYIGRNCLFAKNIVLSTSDNHAIFDTVTYQRLNTSGDVYIGDHCWVCDDVLFLNNSKVANNSVVATRAIVTKKFKDSNILLGGIPAKVIRMGINWDRFLGDNVSDYRSLFEKQQSVMLNDAGFMDKAAFDKMIDNYRARSEVIR